MERERRVWWGEAIELGGEIRVPRAGWVCLLLRTSVPVTLSCWAEMMALGIPVCTTVVQI